MRSGSQLVQELCLSGGIWGSLFDITKFPWEAISAASTIAIAFIGFEISGRVSLNEAKRSQYTLLVEYRKELMSFSEQFSALIAQAISLVDCDLGDNLKSDKASEISSKLSSLVDIGRFIFPNDVNPPNDFGREKGPAFAGARRPALDAVMAAFFVVESIRVPTESRLKLLEANRNFLRTDQPPSVMYDRKSAKSVLLEARRAYMNVVVPDTFPREWDAMFKDLLGPVRVSK